MGNAQSITLSTLSNGLTLIVEQVPDVQSVAYELAIPGGVVLDPTERIGSALLLAELTSRGAGELKSRELSEAFDNLGIRHSESAGHDRFVYRGSLLAEHLNEALRLTALMVQSPSMPESEVDPIKSLLLQDIAALRDDPGRRVMVELSQRYYPEPWNRPAHGSEEGIHKCVAESVRADWKERFGPHGSVLSIAGNCKADKVAEVAKKHFQNWTGESLKLPSIGSMPPHANYHIAYDSAQLQIALACPSAPYGSEHFYAAKVACGVLSGGMHGRLFTEVREKRGLVYSVHARHGATKDFGTLTAYAGTTPARAQDTLDVLLEQLHNLRGTVQPDQLQRAKVNLKASLVIG